MSWNINYVHFVIRYSRGSRSLADNLRKAPASAVQSSMSSNQTTMEVDEDEEYDIPDEIEDVIGM